MICDRYGLPLTTTSDRAAAYYVDGVDRMLAALHGADAAFEAAIAKESTPPKLLAGRIKPGNDLWRGLPSRRATGT